MVQSSRDELLDALFDLQHDLGKYLLLPIAWLPADASHEEIREAALKALLKTREMPSGDRSAEELWRAFLAEVGATLEGLDAWPQLVAAMDRARKWQETLETSDAPPDRAMITADYKLVAESIRTLIEEFEHAE